MSHDIDSGNDSGTDTDDVATDVVTSDDGSVDASLGTPSDNTTLTAVLAGLEDDGFGAQFVALEEARLECSACGETSAAGELDVVAIRRLEGASDPDDMLSVVAAVCPACGQRGTVVLGFGPTASSIDADVSAALRS